MIQLPVDVANPGQFFACCGLLELADRQWRGADGWFAKGTFCLLSHRPECEGDPHRLLDALMGCELANTMPPADLQRLEELCQMKGAVRARNAGLEEEKKTLEKRYREEPILLADPFNLRIDWFLDDLSGGNRFKTWAGQQSVLDIALSMKNALTMPIWQSRSPGEWLTSAATGCGLPFNFDSDLGSQGSALDVGFSFDPLSARAITRIVCSVRPGLELLAFIGLQRFRPRQIPSSNRYLYCAWDSPLPPAVAAAAACGLLTLTKAWWYEFRLLYRTKYLKCFLPAIPVSGDPYE